MGRKSKMSESENTSALFANLSDEEGEEEHSTTINSHQGTPKTPNGRLADGTPTMPRDMLMAMCKQIVDAGEAFATKRLIRSRAATLEDVVALKDDNTVYSYTEIRAAIMNEIKGKFPHEISLRAIAHAILDSDKMPLTAAKNANHESEVAATSHIDFPRKFAGKLYKLRNLSANSLSREASTEKFRNAHKGQQWDFKKYTTFVTAEWAKPNVKEKYAAKAEELQEERRVALLNFFNKHPQFTPPPDLRKVTDAAVSKKEEREEKARVRQALGTPAKKSAVNSAPINPYFIFATEKRAAYMEKYDQNEEKANHRMEKKWAKMSDESKAEYETKSKELHAMTTQGAKRPHEGSPAKDTPKKKKKNKVEI